MLKVKFFADIDEKNEVIAEKITVANGKLLIWMKYHSEEEVKEEYIHPQDLISVEPITEDK